ncbi:MAG: hypothetical protein MJY83_05005 [Bacteroidales bacterium]|nr:hypothetical protein [Bacteroidales bacterium]
MKASKRRNRSTIQNAFLRLYAAEKTGIRSALEENLQAKVRLALEMHEADGKDIHLRNRHYGWVVLHDGKIISSKFWDGSDATNDWAKDAVIQASADHTRGWVGLLICELSDNAGYKVNYEVDVFEAIIDDMTGEFTFELMASIQERL